MRKNIIVALVLVCAVTLCACAIRPAQGSSGDKILLGREEVSEPVLEWAESKADGAEGVFRKTFGEWDAYVVLMGEKPTAGYVVRVENAGMSGGKVWIVDVVFESPAPGDMVAEVITYPYEVFSVPKGTPVKVRSVQPDGSTVDLTIK